MILLFILMFILLYVNSDKDSNHSNVPVKIFNCTSGVKLFILMFILLYVNSDKDSNHCTNHAKSLYSSLQCTGGVQNIHCSQFFKPFDSYPHAHTKRVRTCKLKNVCYINGVVTFYAANDGTARSLYNPSSLPNGLLKNRNISVIHGTVPDNIQYSPYSYSFLYSSDLGFNFGHFLTDDMMSIFFGMDLYDVPENDFDVYTDNFCNSSTTLKHNKTERCLSMYKNLYQYIFDTEKKILTSNDKICFKNLIVGHENVFSQENFELARAGFIRRFRDRIVKRAGLTPKLRKTRSEKQTIVVLTKDNDSLLYKSSYLALRLCNMVTVYTAAILPPPEVICISNISTMSFQSQLELSLNATLVISEHGTLSYFNIFVRTGTVAIVIAPLQDDFGIKDPHIFLHLTHVQIFYLRPSNEYSDLEDTIFEKDFYSTLLHGLYISADNFNINMTELDNIYAKQPIVSGRLQRMIDSVTPLTIDVGSNKSIYEVVWSQDRCKSTYKWCLNTYDRDGDICENIYDQVKEKMKAIDEKKLYNCE